jgi:hypothetical protein
VIVGRYLLLSALASLVIVKGIIPSCSVIGTDFANYYTSSFVLVHERENVGKLYDSQWFSDRAQQLGGPRGSIFQPFPPPTALLFAPLTFVDMKQAKILWMSINLAILAGLVVVLSRMGEVTYTRSVFLLLISGFALINNFYLGQVYLLMTFLLALSIWLIMKEKEVWGGIAAGLFIPIKYFPLCLVLAFLLEKRWLAAVSAVLTSFAVVCLSLILMGSEIHRAFVDHVLLNHLDGEMVNPFSATYQSWNALLRSLFVMDSTANPDPLIAWASGFPFLRGMILAALTVILAWMLKNGLKMKSRFPLIIGSLFSFVLLIAPATATYHFLVLSIPMVLVSSEWSKSNQNVPQLILLVLYVGIGVIPAGAYDSLHLAGAWKILAYPRLFLLLGFFLTFALMIRSEQWHAQSSPNLMRPQ